MNDTEFSMMLWSMGIVQGSLMRPECYDRLVSAGVYGSTLDLLREQLQNVRIQLHTGIQNRKEGAT